MGMGSEYPEVWLPFAVERALLLCRSPRGVPRAVIRCAKEEAAEITRRLGVGPKSAFPSCRELRAAVRAAARLVAAKRRAP